MGLLDNFTQDDILSGLLSAGAASGAKGNYLARVAAGLATGERFKQGRQEQARQRSQDEMQAEYRDLQRKKMQFDMEREQRAVLGDEKKAAETQRIEGLIRDAYQPRGGMGQGLPAGSLPDELSMPPQPVLQQPGKVDFMRLRSLGVPDEALKKLSETAALGKPKVTRIETVSIAGKPMKIGLDDGGNQVVQIGMEWKPLQFQDFGGDVRSFDQTNPQAGFTSVGKKSMSFSDQNAAANTALSQKRFAFDQAGGADAGKPQFVEGQFVYKPSAQFPQGRAFPASGFNRAESGKLTEDQGKATGWLVQAENAYANMRAATTAKPSAAKPGFNDVLAAIPSMGLTTGAANMMRGEDRQKFIQAASSLSESLLRAATGAGVNKDEAEQKIRELMPQIGDGDEVIKQKNAAIPKYIESLKVRAGPGAKQAAGISGNSGASGSWGEPKFLGFE